MKYSIVAHMILCIPYVACSNPPALNTKSEIRAKIATLDTDPLTREAVDAVNSGCIRSTSDIEEFVAGFLEAIDADTSFSDDEDIQNDIDNIEMVDTDDLDSTCGEFGGINVENLDPDDFIQL